MMRASGETQVISPNTSPAPPSARRQMHEMEIVGRAVDRRIHGHRRHDDAIGQRHAARPERRQRRRQAIVRRRRRARFPGIVALETFQPVAIA